jgi:hypothetical protein
VSVAATERCPSCGRPNVNWRVTCLYCGARMPNPAPPPPPRAVPDNLDGLVRDAMRGGSLDAVRRALEESKGAGPTPLAAVTPPAQEGPASQTPQAPPTRVPPTPHAAPATQAPSTSQAPPTPASALTRLLAAASRAEALTGDPAALAAALDTVAGCLAEARATLIAPLPPVVLPPIRHAYALVLDGVGDPAVAEVLARALEVDVATARTAAAVRHIQIALRGAEAAGLERRAASVARDTAFRATVVTRAAIAALPAARCVVAREPGGGWRVLDRPLWEEEPDPSSIPEGVFLGEEPVFLALPGEVEVKEGRSGTEPNRWLRQGYTADATPASRRVSVLDLHVPSGILRVTASGTRFRSFPEHDPASDSRSLKLLVEALPSLFPGVRVEARRTCAATGAAGDARYTTGWPQWEEYTRAARLHVDRTR